MSLVLDNFKIRVFENCYIFGIKYKEALGFTYRLSTNFKQELFIVPFLNGEKIQMIRGNGHIRMDVKRSFKEDLRNIDPDFPAVFAFYSEKGEKIKNFEVKCCGF